MGLHNLRFESSVVTIRVFPSLLRVLGFTLIGLVLVISIPQSTSVSRMQHSDWIRPPFLGL